MSVDQTAAGTIPANSTPLPANEFSSSSSQTTAGATNGHDTSSEPSKNTLDQDLMAVWNKLNPRRNELGEFAPYKNGKDQTETTTESETTTTETELSADQPADGKVPDQGKTEEVTTTPVMPAIEAPTSWSAEMKAKFASLPPELQTYVVARDKETHTAITRAGQEISAFEPLRNVIEQNFETFQRNNLHPAEGINRLLAMERWLGEDPDSAIAEIAKAYRVDLRKYAGQPPVIAAQTDPNAPPAAQQDPLLASLQEQLRGTQTELRRVTSYLTEQQKAERAAQHQSALDQQNALARKIANFASETKDGKPIRPHFDLVRLAMAGLMDSGAAETIEDAYDMAVHANPTLRKQISAEQKAAEDKKRAEENAKKVADAKKAAGVNVKSSISTGATPKTIDDTLRETWRRLNS